MSARLKPGRQLILGVFIVGTLSLLTYYTFFLKELSLFTEQEQISERRIDPDRRLPLRGRLRVRLCGTGHGEQRRSVVRLL